MTLPIYETCERCGDPKRADERLYCHDCADHIWNSHPHPFGFPKRTVFECSTCGERGVDLHPPICCGKPMDGPSGWGG